MNVRVTSTLVILAISVVSLMLDRTRSDQARSVNRLVSQGARYSVVANQDTSPMMGFLHATYATVRADRPLLERQLWHYVYGRNGPQGVAQLGPTLLDDLFSLVIQFLVG